MQAAVHLPPALLSQYSHTALNCAPNTNTAVMPTPPLPARKRKRPPHQQYTVSYSEVQELDNNTGRLRDVIVIDDTPPPSTVSPASTLPHLYSASYQPPVYSAPIRTRARAAAEAQGASASTSVAAAPPPKKRKREPLDVAGGVAKKLVTNGHPQNVTANDKSWASGSGAAVDDVCALLNCGCMPTWVTAKC